MGKWKLACKRLKSNVNVVRPCEVKMRHKYGGRRMMGWSKYAHIHTYVYIRVYKSFIPCLDVPPTVIHVIHFTFVPFAPLSHLLQIDHSSAPFSFPPFQLILISLSSMFFPLLFFFVHFCRK